MGRNKAARTKLAKFQVAEGEGVKRLVSTVQLDSKIGNEAAERRRKGPRRRKVVEGEREGWNEQTHTVAL